MNFVFLKLYIYIYILVPLLLDNNLIQLRDINLTKNLKYQCNLNLNWVTYIYRTTFCQSLLNYIMVIFPNFKSVLNYLIKLCIMIYFPKRKTIIILICMFFVGSSQGPKVMKFSSNFKPLKATFAFIPP